MAEEENKPEVNVNVKPQGKGGMIAAIVTAVLALLMVVGIYFKLYQKGAKLAKLQHERDKERMKQEMAAANALLAESTVELEDALRGASEARERQVRIRAQIEQERASREALRAELQSLEDWDSVEEFVRRNKS